MSNCWRWVLCACALPAALLCGCEDRPAPPEKAKEQKPGTIVIRSIKPKEDPQEKPSWVARYGLTWDDYERFQAIETVTGLVPLRIFPQEVKRGDKVFNARVVATTQAYEKINRFEMAVGRFLVDGEDQRDEGDDQRFRNVIVLGARVAEELFPAAKETVGQTVVLNQQQYRVVGVIKDRPPTDAPGFGKEDFNQDVYLPIKTCQVRFGERIIIRQGGSRTAEQVELHQITLIVSDPAKVQSTAEVVRDLLQRHHTKQDWQIMGPAQQ
jgi:putative ABC transport system permease protein